MKIRTQTLMVLGVTCIILFALLFLATEQIVETSFSLLEENEVATNVARASNALDVKIQTLGSNAYDYGVWADTFYFVQGENEGYINETLFPSILTNLGTNMMLFYDSSNKLYYATGVDMESGEEKNISSSMLDHFSTNTILFSHPEKQITGIINSPEGLLLIASNPIKKISGDGPTVGTIIFARYLDAAVIEELEEQTHLSFGVQNFNEKSASLDPEKLSSVLDENDNLYINPQNETSIVGTTVLNDVNGNPVLILDAEMDRGIYQQGKSAINYVFAVILIIGIVCGIVIMTLLDRTVLDRLSLLSSNLTYITEKGSLSSRVGIKGKDELNNLADKINHMLEALEKNEIEFQQIERDNKQRMETVLSSIICGTLLIDAETHIITDANPTAIEIIGLPKEKILGNVDSDFICPVHKEDCLPTLPELTVNKSESILVNADGKEIPVLISIVPVSLSDKKYLVKSFVDMTRIKETENALIETEEKFEKISTSAQDAIIMIDNKGIITFWNHAAEKMFDYTREEVMGKEMHGLIALPEYEDRYKRGLEGFMVDGKGPAIGQILSVYAKKQNGAEFPVELSLSTFKLKTGTWHAAGIIRDITDRRRAEEALLNAKINAETANRSKSDFLATMSHELRTPLNSIIGFSDLMIDGGVGETSDMQKKFLGNISTSGKHLLSLINNILDLSKVEAGKMELSYELFGVYVTIDEVKQLVSPLADKKGLKLEFNKEESLDKIYADRLRFKQILFNLASNAIKFSHPGGKITISATKIKDKAQFSVEDTGIGISDENKSKLFQPFTQLESTTTRRYEGTGLGLSLVKKFIEMHGGQIWVESELGEGTKFTFELPLKPVSKEESTIQMVPSPETIEKASNVLESRISVPQIIESSNSEGDGPLILVVEDDEPSRELLEITLKNEGYSVASAKNGKEALELARKMKPFAITLDIMMPGMDGWDVLKHLKEKEQTHNIPVIITSMLEEHELGVVWGAIDHLNKPIEKEILLATFERLKGKMPKSSHTVLVVDDETTAVELIVSMLSGEEVNVLTAYGGKEAIDIALRERPDVIILDLMMPVISGFDVIKALKTNPETIDILIIICTAKDLDSDDRKTLDGNVTSIMQKGMLSREKLIDFIKALEKRTSSKDHTKVHKEEACV
jgi:PAS domain S-box-containing protein